MNAEVLKWAEESLIQGFPETQIGRDAAIKPLQNILAVSALWRSRQAEQYLGVKRLKQSLITGCRRVVKFIYDYDVVGIRFKPCQAIRVQ